MLQGKTALVTGGGRGIGRAIAESLAEAGARVVVTGRREAEVGEVARAVGGVAMLADLGDRAAIDALVRRLADEVGPVDVLVNNAGIAESAPFDRTTDESWDRTMAVNATAPFLLTRALVPAMIARNWGRVVNVASNAGRSGYAYTAAYCASKHALVGLTRALAVELGKTGVTVNAVCPGWVRTDMAAAAVSNIADKTKRSPEQAERVLAAMSPQNRLMEASEVAFLVRSLCADEARGIHGQAIVLDGGQLLA
jgi:NAD(P)-dependent dehydrogenase (short-subunit alcohol dehydrogenase family)